ncbi:MAG: T9SS type A sorting domain-containing protein [Armatimonadetes bacterium]|nr:T9SS type A sorting domain-containing protein [Armatimonadota bacterium]
MRNILIKIFMIVVFMIFSFCLYSQVFPPPENVAVDIYTGLLTWDPPGGTIYDDDFESYNVGEYLAVQSDYWTTWSNAPGGPEDAFVSEEQALSGTQSVKIDGSSDVVLIMDNYTSGCYSMDLNMYVVSGNTAHFNLQKTNTPGEQWAMEIYFDVNGEACVYAGAAAACVFPFDFDTWMNFEIIADLDNDLGELCFNGTLLHTWQWSLTTWGVPGLLSLGGMNMYAWASAGNNPLYYFDDITLSFVNAEPSDELTGYNVYLDDMTIPIAENIPDLVYQLTNLVGWENYVVGVSAVYDDPGESLIVVFTFCFQGGIYHPENLVATVFDYNDVHLEWEPPGWTGGLLAYHTGYDNNGIGTGAAADWMCAARFTADELADFYGSDLTAVNVHIRTADFSYVAVKVWEGGSFGDPGTEIYSEDITGSVLIEDWTEHTLTTPVPLVAGNEYWIGYDMSATGDHPASVDAGPAIACKGDWMFYEGIWQEISVAFALDYNWCIEGVVGAGDEILMTSRVTKNNHTPRLRSMISSGTPEVLTTHPRTKRIENNRDNRMLLGYKVYRDGVEIFEIFDPNELTYDDLGLDGDTYEYWVTAIYDYGESEPSNVEEVTVVLNPPQNLEAMIQGMNNVFLSWDAPAERELESYNVYRNGVVICNVTSTFYLDVNVPPGTYVYNTTAVYCGGWESGFSNDAIFDNSDVEDTPLPLVTELNGNYPNPFNPETSIKFALNESGQVRIDVFNLKGQHIRTVVNEHLEASYHSVVWDGKDANGVNVSSGVYFYKMDATKYTSIRKMVLMK